MPAHTMTADQEHVPKGGDGKEVSLSVEETNKVRAKFGLHALDVDDEEKEKEVRREKAGKISLNRERMSGSESRWTVKSRRDYGAWTKEVRANLAPVVHVVSCAMSCAPVQEHACGC